MIRLILSFCFPRVAYAFDVMSKTHCQVVKIYPYFSSKKIIILALTFKSLVHLELMFVYDVREETSFLLLHVAIIVVLATFI